MKIDETIFEKLGVKETGFCQKFREGGGHVNRRHQWAMSHWIAKKMSHQDPFFFIFSSSLRAKFEAIDIGLFNGF